MQIVINIPQGRYEDILSGKEFRVYQCDIRDVLKHGSPLPKGHGRLIDADKLVPDCQEDFVYYDDDEHNEFTAVGIAQIECADTVVEADKEGEECR